MTLIRTWVVRVLRILVRLVRVLVVGHVLVVAWVGVLGVASMVGTCLVDWVTDGLAIVVLGVSWGRVGHGYRLFSWTFSWAGFR